MKRDRAKSALKTSDVSPSGFAMKGKEIRREEMVIEVDSEFYITARCIVLVEVS